jgi:hypothetical protein
MKKRRYESGDRELNIKRIKESTATTKATKKEEEAEVNFGLDPSDVERLKGLTIKDIRLMTADDISYIESKFGSRPNPCNQYVDTVWEYSDGTLMWHSVYEGVRLLLSGDE